MGTFLQAHRKLHKGNSGTRINTEKHRPRLAFLLSAALSRSRKGGTRMRHSQFPRGLFYSLSSVHMPSFTLIGQQLPHCSLTCWKITSALSAPPSFPNYSYTKMTESVPWLCIPPLKFTAPHCPRPEVPGLSRCPDFISYADLCTLLSVLCPVPSKANIQCLSSLCSQQILSQTAAAPLPAGWGGGGEEVPGWWWGYHRTELETAGAGGGDRKARSTLGPAAEGFSQE